MTKDFVPYSEALVLKILGFDERCYEVYEKDGRLCNTYESTRWQNENPELVIGAPLYQQAFRWFREKHDLISYVHPLALLQDTKKWCYEITNFESSWDEDSNLHTPEEAELACLQKLIQIVKNEIIALNINR
jgi:hypothetical protein